MSDPINQWITALGDLDREIRRKAQDELRRIGQPALPLLIEALDSAQDAQRDLIVELLVEAAHPAIVPILIVDLQDDDKMTRYQAVERLGTIGDPAAIQPLIATFLDADIHVQNMATEALVGFGDAAVQPLIGVLQSHTEEESRYRAAYALGTIGHPAALEPLLVALNDVSARVRSSAIYALEGGFGRSDKARVVQAITAALDDPEARVRIRAATKLERLADPAPVPKLIALLDDRGIWFNTRVDVAAASALWRIGTDVAQKAATAWVETAMRDPDPKTRGFAALQMDAMGDVHLLGLALQDSDEIVRAFAIGGLSRLKDPAAVSLLSEALRDPDPHNRSEAARALHHIGTPEAQAALQGWDGDHWDD